ncbi:MAG TPA: hypothetical protein DCL44_00995 [Elusimicrobia bacterium]|nr:hypothetical protein [Elusimicrobiota bacterium]
MKRKKKKMVLMEFAVEVYTDGRIEWNGFERFLCWKLNHKPKEGFLPYARKIQTLQPFLPKNG